MSVEITTIVFTQDELDQLELERELSYKRLAIKHLESQGKSAEDFTCGPVLEINAFTEDLYTGLVTHELVSASMEIRSMTEEEKKADAQYREGLEILMNMFKFQDEAYTEPDCCGKEDCVHDEDDNLGNLG